MSSAYEVSVAAETLYHFSDKAYTLVGLAIDRHLHIQVDTFALFISSKEGYVGRQASG